MKPLKYEKVSVRELLAPLIISQANLATSGGGTGVDLAFVLALMGKKRKRKKPDVSQILRMLWSLNMLRKLDTLQGAVQLG